MISESFHLFCPFLFFSRSSVSLSGVVKTMPLEGEMEEGKSFQGKELRDKDLCAQEGKIAGVEASKFCY